MQLSFIQKSFQNAPFKIPLVALMIQMWAILACATTPTILKAKETYKVSTENPYLQKNDVTTIRITATDNNVYLSTAPNVTVSEAEGKFLLQVTASKDREAVNNLGQFYRQMNMSVYLIIKENDPLPYRLLIGTFESWADARTFKEQHQSMVPDDSWIHYPFSYDTLLPFDR